MAISRVLSESSTDASKSTITQDFSGTIIPKDYLIVHVVSWHRSNSTAPVLSTITFADRVETLRLITLSLLSTQTRNEAIADGGYCTVSTYGGRYFDNTLDNEGQSGNITNGRLTVSYGSTVDYIFTMSAVYRGVAINPTYILGTIDDNNGDSTTHDYGSITSSWPNFWLNLLAVIWDTESNMGTYTLDIPSGFTLLQHDLESSSPGTNYVLYIGMLDDGPYPVSGTVAPSPDDTSTAALQWITVLIPINGDDSFPQDGGMGVFF